MNFEEHITKKKITAHLFTCPECGKEIQDQSKKRVISLAKQHYVLKHGEEE